MISKRYLSYDGTIWKTGEKLQQKYRASFRRTAPRGTPGFLPLEAALSARPGMDVRSRQVRLHRLWQNWNMVMGGELADRAYPLGHRDKTLLVGAADQFLLQELVYFIPEILERVNAFMGEKRFSRAELHPLAGRTPLNFIRGREILPAPPPPCPPRLGGLTGKFDPSLPESHSYEACVRFFHSLYPHLVPIRKKT
jgi:hypothetical protein